MMTVKDIKLELRSMMNGVASAAMRQSADYRVNFGVEIPRLEEFCQALLDDDDDDDDDDCLAGDFAEELWKERVRECRILALMMMGEKLRAESQELRADVSSWIGDIKTKEIARYAALYLFQYLPDAETKAKEWLASDDEVKKECGRCLAHWVERRAALVR